MRDASRKRFSIVEPEGRGLASGWWLLAEKLQHLGVVVIEGAKVGGFVGEASIGLLQVRNGD